VKVVIQHLLDGGVALIGSVEPVQLFGGVGAEQVVEGVPAGDVLDDQVGAGQLGQQRPHPFHWHSREAGHGRDGSVRSGVQPEDPEQPCRLGV
jgi:hypothetical protein